MVLQDSILTLTQCVLTLVLSLYLFNTDTGSLLYTESLRPKVEICSWPGRDEDVLKTLVSLSFGH